MIDRGTYAPASRSLPHIIVRSGAAADVRLRKGGKWLRRRQRGARELVHGGVAIDDAEQWLVHQADEALTLGAHELYEAGRHAHSMTSKVARASSRMLRP